VIAEVSVFTSSVPFQQFLLVEVKDDGYTKDVIFLRQCDQAFPGGCLNICCVNNSEFAELEPLCGDCVQ